MAIFIDKETRLVVQGITGRDGSFHTSQMMEYGTQVVAGVTPGKGGQTFTGPDGSSVPIFNAMDEAVMMERLSAYDRLLTTEQPIVDGQFDDAE